MTTVGDAGRTCYAPRLAIWLRPSRKIRERTGTERRRTIETTKKSVFRRSLVLGLIAVFSVTLGGCGDSHESATEDMLDTVEEMNEILAGIKSEADAEAAASDLEDLAEDMKAIKARMEALGDPEKDMEASLKEKYGDRLQKLMGTFIENLMRLSTDPKLKGPLEEAMKKLQDAQK